MDITIESKVVNDVDVSETKSPSPKVQYSPYFRAAKGIYNKWVHEGTGRPKYAIVAYERLKGVESALAFCMRESTPSEFEKLNTEYISIRNWIFEVVKRPELNGYKISIMDRIAAHQDQQASELVSVGGADHE